MIVKIKSKLSGKSGTCEIVGTNYFFSSKIGLLILTLSVKMADGRIEVFNQKELSDYIFTKKKEV